MDKMKFREELDSYIEIINSRLAAYLDFKKDYNRTIIDAMKYSLFAGGKRLRPVLALAAYRLFGEDIEEILPYACGLEMIHTYSLIHDDLPCMDNDDYRRGKLTNHKVYGEGIATLAGDGLLNYSFEIMIDSALNSRNTESHLRGIKEIAGAAGINGMIGGQVVDLESENKDIDKKTLEYIHLNKTAALITAPLKVAAIIGGGSEKDIDYMRQVGLKLGLAFQIKDDILDIIGDEDKLGKATGSDMDKLKATYPALFGLQPSINRVQELTEKANSLISLYGNKSKFLLELSDYLLNRDF